MPAQQTRARHAAPKPAPLSRPRAALLPGTLLAAAGIAFGGLAAFPASAADITPRVTAASALQPVALPAPQQEEEEPQAQPNVLLNQALQQGLAVANKPQPAPLQKASRDRDEADSADQPDQADQADQAEGSDEDAPAVSDRLFVRPGIGRLTSSYGRRWGRLHAGIDLASGVGSPIRAVTHGTVLSAGWEGGYGRCVRIVHSDGTVTVYAHLSAITVRSGQRVVAGQRIGREGNTGQSTGPHLHFEVRVNGTPVNPVSWLRKRGIAL